MDSTIRVALELLLLGGVALALAGSLALPLRPRLGGAMVQLGTLALGAFCVVGAAVFLAAALGS